MAALGIPTTWLTVTRTRQRRRRNLSIARLCQQAYKGLPPSRVRVRSDRRQGGRLPAARPIRFNHRDCRSASRDDAPGDPSGSSPVARTAPALPSVVTRCHACARRQTRWQLADGAASRQNRHPIDGVRALLARRRRKHKAFWPSGALPTLTYRPPNYRPRAVMRLYQQDRPDGIPSGRSPCSPRFGQRTSSTRLLRRQLAVDPAAGWRSVIV